LLRVVKHAEPWYSCGGPKEIGQDVFETISSKGVGSRVFGTREGYGRGT
jgi:hypothetical protein